MGQNSPSGGGSCLWRYLQNSIEGGAHYHDHNSHSDNFNASCVTLLENPAPYIATLVS
jgi:hypothetical protein